MPNNKELSIAEIHHETLNVLKKIIQICDEIDVNYFIAYGTLIGAVRHKGFIPWDDDLDIQMTRPEFNKFVKYCEENADDLHPYKLVSFQNTKDYPYAIPRFCNMDFRMEKGGLYDAGMGVFVDVYPMDGIGNDFDEAKQKIVVKKRFLFTCWGFWRENKFVFSKKRWWRNIPRFLVFLASRIHNLRYYLDKLHSFSTLYPYEDSKYVECVIWNNSFSPLLKEWYSKFEFLEFEGLKVKAPCNFDIILRLIYGDYMQLPPPEQRVPTHNYKIFRR